MHGKIFLQNSYPLKFLRNFRVPNGALMAPQATEPKWQIASVRLLFPSFGFSLQMLICSLGVTIHIILESAELNILRVCPLIQKYLSSINIYNNKLIILGSSQYVLSYCNIYFYLKKHVFIVNDDKV
jgi:hypothetical protein